VQSPHTACPPCARKPCSGWKIRPRQAGEKPLILGAVIAGGRSSRFGSDKAEALLGGTPLIDHAAALLRPHVDALVLCGRERVGWLCLPDRPAANLGPLGGVSAALRHASDHGFETVLTIGCDMPDVPQALLAVLAGHAPAYCRDAPILACWPASLATALDRHLAADPKRSVRNWADNIGASVIASPGPLANINTPADLATL
jgi:molybdopterin-guanine dinucleotide biosynthesis protein A